MALHWTHLLVLRKVLPQPAGNALNAAKDAAGCLCHKDTLLAPGYISAHQDYVLLCRFQVSHPQHTLVWVIPPQERTWQFSLLNVRFLFAHSSSLSVSLCTTVQPSAALTALPYFVSSPRLFRALRPYLGQTVPPSRSLMKC